MLALAIRRAQRCPQCGGPISECGPDTEGRWVATPRRCHRMTALLQKQDARTNTKHPQALSWQVVRRDQGRG